MINGIVLIQCGDHFENQSRIFPLAVHLKNLGCRPVLMMYSKKNSSRIFEVGGFDCIYLEKYRAIAGKDDIGNAEFENISKVEKARAPWKFWPGRIKAERKKLVRDYRALELLLEEVSPDFIGIWNGYTGYVANILRYMSGFSGINRFFMERSVFLNSLFVDTEGVNGESVISELSAADFNVSTKGGWKKSLPLPSALSYADIAPDLSGAVVVFLPLQVQTDTNNILYSPHVKAMRRLVLLVLDAVRKIRNESGLDIRLVVRNHPEEIDSNLNLPNSDFLYYKNDGCISDWCARSVAVVTINSTVGLEAIIAGVPVISLGRSIYSGKGLCLDVNDKELVDAIRKVVIDGWVPDRLLVERYLEVLYLKFTCNKYYFPGCLGGNGVSVDDNGWVYQVDFSDFIRVAYVGPILRLNLTYRKFEELISSSYIKSGVRNILSGSIPDDVDIKVERLAVGAEFDEFDVVIVARSVFESVRFGPIKALILDEYFIPMS